MVFLQSILYGKNDIRVINEIMVDRGQTYNRGRLCRHMNHLDSVVHQQYRPVLLMAFSKRVPAMGWDLERGFDYSLLVFVLDTIKTGLRKGIQRYRE
jgi:hypothetical protein